MASIARHRAGKSKPLGRVEGGACAAQLPREIWGLSLLLALFAYKSEIERVARALEQHRGRFGMVYALRVSAGRRQVFREGEFPRFIESAGSGPSRGPEIWVMRLVWGTSELARVSQEICELADALGTDAYLAGAPKVRHARLQHLRAVSADSMISKLTRWGRAHVALPSERSEEDSATAVEFAL